MDFEFEYQMLNIDYLIFLQLSYSEDMILMIDIEASRMTL